MQYSFAERLGSAADPAVDRPLEPDVMRRRLLLLTMAAHPLSLGIAVRA